jgi:cyclophilin family peptidyl-prolyl cis-trans isomerase
MKEFPTLRRANSLRDRASDHELFEALEMRLALYVSPLLSNLPSVDAMENAQNTVVRLSTSVGVIDIELYDRAGPDGASAAPITTANFLNYISTGRYENSFFHRLATNFVLQGGGHVFVPPSTSQDIQTDAPIQNEFDPGRSNIERTIAMAKLGGDPDSATSQFFFNLGNNAANLNSQNGGFTVFGRVIKGWEVVQSIAGFETRDLDQFFTGTNPPGPGLYDDVPVSGPSDSSVVTIVDAEVIKPGGQTEFFTTALYYPEGYRAAQITSTIDLFAQSVDHQVHYQIIARFEVGSRDRVITSGVIEPGARVSVPISRGGDPTLNLVRPYTPFAYEIRATGALAATLEHMDFGAVASESFLDPQRLDAERLKNWTFANGLVGPGIPAFLVWESLSGEVATLTVSFHTESGQTHTVTKTLQPYRRGGLNLRDISTLPSGLFSVHISSTEPIVAALSQYRVAPGRASAELGMFDDDGTGGGSGASAGVLAGAMIPSDGQSLLSLVYTGDSSVDVNVSFVLSDGTVLSGGTQTLSTSLRRRDFDLRAMSGALPTDEFFTIRYNVSGATPERVGASYTSITAGDTMRTPFQSHSTGHLFFAAGFTSPDVPGREVLSLYNPFAGTTTEVTYRLRFHFVDSQEDEILFPINGTGTLGSRLDIDVASLSDVMARINSNPIFRRYSITVETDITQNGVPIAGAIFGQLTRIGMDGNTVTYNPSLNQGQAPVAPA